MDRPDLAALVVPLGRALVAAERPILAAHGLSMWDYVILLRLSDEPVRSQAALAAAVGADKTRIIDILDDLQLRRLISRVNDPADRRVRLISITAKGRRLRDGVQADIQQNEEHLLEALPAGQRTTLITALQRLLQSISPEDV